MKKIKLLVALAISMICLIGASTIYADYIQTPTISDTSKTTADKNAPPATAAVIDSKTSGGTGGMTVIGNPTDVMVISKLKLQGGGAGNLIEIKQIDVWLKREHPDLVKVTQVDPMAMLMMGSQYKHICVSGDDGKPAMTTIVNGKTELKPFDEKYVGPGYAIVALDAKIDKHAMLDGMRKH